MRKAWYVFLCSLGLFFSITLFGLPIGLPLLWIGIKNLRRLNGYTPDGPVVVEVRTR